MTLKFQSTKDNKVVYLFLTESTQYTNYMNATILYADKNSRIKTLNNIVETLDEAFSWSLNELVKQLDVMPEFIQYH